MRDFVVAVDVGTRSARAGVFDRSGAVLGSGVAELQLRAPKPGSGEYRSEDVWTQVCAAIRRALSDAGRDGKDAAAISFDATCSLVIRDQDGRPLPVSDGEGGDTIAWFDHRATEQAQHMGGIAHGVVDRNGGSLSPEMQLPKLKWLKQVRPQIWDAMGYAFDLADFLAWRASGTTLRSICTVSTKWGYQSDHEGWPAGYLAQAGLADLTDKANAPACAVLVGACLGTVTPDAAAQMGVSVDCRVAAGMVDAYAGALALLDPRTPDALALIAGTSTCVMGYGSRAIDLPGLWGPYADAVLPGHGIYETGASATGAMLDRIIIAFGLEPTRETHDRIGVYIDAALDSDPDFGRGIHVLPDFHGNRSPFADPDARGMIVGMSLDTSFHELCRTYWRGCVGLAMALKQLIEELRSRHGPVRELRMSGGHMRFARLPRLYADATGCVLRVPGHENAAMTGSAVAAAKAAGWGEDLMCLAASMGGKWTEIIPETSRRYDADYGAFLALQNMGRDGLVGLRG